MRGAFAAQIVGTSRSQKHVAFRRHQGKVRLDADPADAKMLNTKSETSGDHASLRTALEVADPATLLLALVQLTGEKHWLEAAKPFIRGPMN
jgi:hypothetical protein